MPKTCSVCSLSSRAEIDQALVAETPLRRVAEQYGTSATALHRHKADHLPALLTKAHDAGEVSRADDLLGQVRDLQEKALSILVQAEAAGDLRVAVSAIREARGNLELLAKMLGLMTERHEVDVRVVHFTIGRGYQE